MQQKNNFFVGFGTFEEFLPACRGKRIYLTSFDLVKTGNKGVQRATTLVTAANIADGICHYWTMSVGRFSAINGVPLVELCAIKEIRERALSAVKCLTAFARDNGFSVTRALVGFPSDLAILEGTTRCVRYVNESNSFERIVPEPVMEEVSTGGAKLAA
jgi:hypothetical protein